MKAEMTTTMTGIENVSDIKNQREHGVRKIQGIRMLSTVLFLCALIGSIGLGVVSEAQASEEEVPQPVQVYQKGVTYFSGVVTANQGKIIQIDHNDFKLHKELRVLDDGGRERKLQEFAAGVWVAFHLKLGKVDQLILKLPQ